MKDKETGDEEASRQNTLFENGPIEGPPKEKKEGKGDGLQEQEEEDLRNDGEDVQAKYIIYSPALATGSYIKEFPLYARLEGLRALE